MILQLLVVVILLFLLQWMRMGMGRGIEGFADANATAALTKHNAFVEESQKKLNPLTNMVNLTQPVAPVGQKTAQQFYNATYHLETKPTSDSYELKADTVYDVPDALPKGLQRAIGCQKAPKTCAAFDRPEFREHCGMSFDKQGIASDGTPHIGGMYVSPDDRAYQKGAAQKVLEERLPPYDPYQVYQPSMGTARPGSFALTKDQCVVVKEKVDCQEKQSFNSPNCTQCFPSQTFSRVAADSPRLPFVLYLAGKGVIRIESRDEPRLTRSTGITLDPTTPYRLDIPASSEGKTFTIQFGEDGRRPPYLSGYLEGDTPRGKYKIDMNILISKDLEIGTRPRMSGMSRIQGFRCLSFVPGPKKKGMRLSCMIPLSFLDIYEPEAIYCDNGPLITKEASAIHIESDPCYAKGNAVGNYKLECLQSRWVALGGTTKGTGYPNTQQKADALQKDKGKGLHLDDIMERLGNKMMEAITGKRMNGVAFTIPEWNDLSMWGLGIPIQTPCDGLQKDEGPLSDACLKYLYRNQGSASHIGGTYTLPSNQMASSKEGFATAEPVPSTFLYPGTSIDPKTRSGLAFGENLGGVEAVKAELDRIHRRANDNTKTNTRRADEVKKAYGVTLPPPSSNKVTGPAQVFAVGPGYQYTKAEAPKVCAKYGARVATTAELEEAQRNGADWCFSGWVTEGVGRWPITTNPIDGCGSRQGVITWTPGDKAGVNCYGPKPDPTAEPAGVIKPFNGDLWNQPTEPTYVTIPSGYLETSGTHNCFNGLSPEQAQKTCDRLGAQCVGFSYSKDGTGSGCYKGNHAGGLNTNRSYMGYVKIGPGAISTPIQVMTSRNWYNLFKVINSNFRITQAGSGNDVQLQLNSHTVYGSQTALWYNQRIQDYPSFVAEFEIYISNPSADGTSFNVGYSSDATHGLGEGPNAPAFSISFHLYAPHRTPGIYLWNGKGQRVGFYAVSLGTSSWIPVKISYIRGDALTWQVFYNNVSVITYNDPSNEKWVTSESGGVFGFTSRTGGATHDAYIRRFNLTAYP